ncbi:MAG: hypothetical protein H6566_18425 [Lewinellaceae bacterium]|nr:hypothetical protein [Lewinellaceae bacterium]
MNENYSKWEKEVLESLEALKEELDQNPKAKGLYNGFYVWDSKFIEKPEIMFIGINPGNGNPNNNGSIEVKPSFQMSYLEYLDGENPTYTIARDTVKAFTKAGYTEEEIRNLLDDKSVKTNFYYIITKKEGDISKCLNSLEKGRFKTYWQQSLNWTGKLIEIVKPKVVICEGKGIFTEMVVNMTGNKNSVWENDCGYFQEGETTFLGYGRVFSNMKNIEVFSGLIKRYIKKK